MLQKDFPAAGSWGWEVSGVKAGVETLQQNTLIGNRSVSCFQLRED